MTKREKSIVLIMILSIIYGAYIYFTGSSQKINNFSSLRNNSELFEFASTVKKKITLQNIPLQSAYILKTAGTQWLTDPFVISQKPLTKEKYTNTISKTVKKVPPKNIDLTYMGYLEINKKRLAIINGIEYEKGESLYLKKNFYVRSISPNRVVIGKLGQAIKFILHLEETD